MATIKRARIGTTAWRQRLDAHRDLLEPWGDRWRHRRAAREKHPVEDFLFTYYSHSPGRLAQWHPGFGVELEVGDEPLPAWFSKRGYRQEDGAVFVDPNEIGEGLLRQIQWIADLLERSAARPAQLGCYGLHEWAMVYRLAPDEVRHEDYPLRLSPEDLAEFVESRQLCCTHYDAFRFFTPSAAPRNSQRPTYQTRLDQEQPGCIHTNMDLYKWAYKLTPWISGELLAEAFFFAAETRAVDMRASPYDLADLGFEPIAIETEAGRGEYRVVQEAIAEKAAPIREAILGGCNAILMQADSLT